jgi:hypothetical protein
MHRSDIEIADVHPTMSCGPAQVSLRNEAISTEIALSPSAPRNDTGRNRVPIMGEPSAPQSCGSGAVYQSICECGVPLGDLIREAPVVFRFQGDLVEGNVVAVIAPSGPF